MLKIQCSTSIAISKGSYSQSTLQGTIVLGIENPGQENLSRVCCCSLVLRYWFHYGPNRDAPWQCRDRDTLSLLCTREKSKIFGLAASQLRITSVMAGLEACESEVRCKSPSSPLSRPSRLVVAGITSFHSRSFLDGESTGQPQEYSLNFLSPSYLAHAEITLLLEPVLPNVKRGQERYHRPD